MIEPGILPAAHPIWWFRNLETVNSQVDPVLSARAKSSGDPFANHLTPTLLSNAAAMVKFETALPIAIRWFFGFRTFVRTEVVE